MFYHPKYGLCGAMFHVHLKTICILLLGRMFYKCQLGQLVGTVDLIFYIPTDILLVLLITERRVLKCPSIIQDLSISSFVCIRFSFMSLEALLLGSYTFRIPIS